MMQYINDLAAYWLMWKQSVVDVVGVSNDAMHIHGSLLLLFGSALLLRRRPDNILSWLFVFGLELFNEYADLHGQTAGEDSIKAGLHDIYNTMFWPTLILLFGWYFFPKRLPVKISEELPSSDLVDEFFEKPTAI
jgi:hypothetical protein